MKDNLRDEIQDDIIDQNNEIINEMKLRLYVSAEYLSELKSEASELFTECESGSRYYMELPANIEENEYLGNSIIACCETVLIMMNPKYEIDENTELNCELLKLSASETSFNLFISIKYPKVDDTFNDILVFRECKVEEFLYSFELLGDQRIFASEM